MIWLLNFYGFFKGSALFSYTHSGANGNHGINFIHLAAFQANTAVCPVLEIVHRHIIPLPGSMDADAVAYFSVRRNQSLGFPLVEFGLIGGSGVVE